MGDVANEHSLQSQYLIVQGHHVHSHQPTRQHYEGRNPLC